MARIKKRNTRRKRRRGGQAGKQSIPELNPDSKKDLPILMDGDNPARK
jgi:hypothetical protein